MERERSPNLAPDEGLIGREDIQETGSMRFSRVNRSDKGLWPDPDTRKAVYLLLRTSGMRDMSRPHESLPYFTERKNQ